MPEQYTGWDPAAPWNSGGGGGGGSGWMSGLGGGLGALGMFLGGPAGGALGLLGGLGSLFLPKPDPMKQYQDYMRQWTAAYPQNHARLTNTLFNTSITSPAYTGAVSNLYGANQQMQQSLASSLGARGLTQSGIGSIAGPMAASQFGTGMAGLRAAAWNTASDQAGQSLQQGMGLSQFMLPRDASGNIFNVTGYDKLAALLSMLSRMQLLYGQQQQR